MKNKGTKPHTYRLAFYPTSKLSDSRKQELIAWVSGLSGANAEKLKDLMQDSRNEVIAEGK